MTPYDAAYFIAKFEGIPEDQWCTDRTTNERGQHCAIGHLDHEGGDALCRLFARTIGSPVVNINDKICTNYKQPTPKQRILAALRDIQARGG